MTELIKNYNNNEEINFYNLYSGLEKFMELVFTIIDIVFYNLQKEFYEFKNILENLKYKYIILKNKFLDINQKQILLEKQIYKTTSTLLKEINKRDDIIKELQKLIKK